MNKFFGLIIFSCLLFLGGLAQAATPLVSVNWVKDNVEKFDNESLSFNLRA